MDSNFQVVINANIQGLQKAISDAQATLSKFNKSVDSTSTSVKNLEQNSNRGRLAAFAFGQVLRDAGFFSQSFGLGLLAISNNIPILIDQITLSVKALAPFAAGISLAGSVLTALLTIWAYSALAADKSKQSIDEWRESLEDVTEVQLRGKQAALDEVTSLDMLYRAATDVTNSMDLRLKAAKALQEQYPTTFANLSAEQIALGKNEAAYNGLRDSIIGAAMAEAAKDKIVANASRILDNDTAILEARIAKQKLSIQLAKEEAIAAEDLAYQRLTNENQIGEYTPKNAGKLGSLTRQIAEQQLKINNAITDTNILTGRNINLQVEAGKYTKQWVDSLDDGTDSTKETVQETVSLADKLNQIFAKTRDNFKGGGLLLADDQAQKDALEFIDIVDELIYKGKTLAEVNDLITESTPSTYVPVDIAKLKKAFEDAMAEAARFEAEMNAMFTNAFANVAGAIGEAIGSGANVFEAFGNAVLASIGGILVQFGQLTLAAGVAAAGLGKALRNPTNPANAALAIASGLALIAIGSMVGAFASKNGGGGSGGDNNSPRNANPMFGGITKFASGGIVSGPTNALIGEYPGARSNPEVVAPLDKLTGIIAGSIGGGFGGQLTTRISGNDLVILLDRASKNRKNYF
jgi:hypothetical protein